MRARGRRDGGTLLLLGIVSSARAWAEPSASNPPASEPAATAPTADPDAEKTARARRHFKNGIKLYKDADYRGALAEFEAAYREKPGAGSLQNVALSLKGLFRYAEAADALRLLLSRHGDQLNEEERRSLQTALDEIASLVGTLEVTVDPPGARVSVNGRALTASERARGLLLNVGEHTLVAEAPGYARRVQVVRIASEQRQKVHLALEATSGFLEIVAADPKAAIAVDGDALAYHRWTGPVAPDVDHVVQIYRQGFEPFETSARVEIGETLRISGALGPPTGEAIDPTPPGSGKPGAPPRTRLQKGFYALGVVGVAGVNDSPLGIEVSSTDMSMPSLGARAGYRLSQTLGIEAALDFGRVDVNGACDRVDGVRCVERNFVLSSLRFGPNLRLYTPGETVRFPITIGAGIVSHRLELEAAENLEGGDARGSDPYFCIELAASYNYRHLLIELGLTAYIEGASELRGTFDGEGRTSAFESGTLPLLGLTLKVGYSAWAPKR